MESGTWGVSAWGSMIDVVSIAGALTSIILGVAAVGLALHLYRRNDEASDQVFKACRQLIWRLEVASLERATNALAESPKQEAEAPHES